MIVDIAAAGAEGSVAWLLEVPWESREPKVMSWSYRMPGSVGLLGQNMAGNGRYDGGTCEAYVELFLAFLFAGKRGRRHAVLGLGSITCWFDHAEQDAS